MTHPSAEQVAEYLEGVLGSDDHDRVRAHLEQCGECAATARDLAAVTDALRTAGAAPPAIPQQVAARVESAISAEARNRASQTTPTGASVSAAAATSAGPSSLAERRQRRRRALAGGLLAAAAATVVAVGLGEMVGTGGLGGGSASESAGETAVSGQAQADRSRPEAQARPDGLRAQRRGPGVAVVPEQPDGLPGPRLTERGLTRAELIDAVAARHIPGTVRRDRPACVEAALGPAARTAAAYAVRLPAGSGQSQGTRGLVVLRPGVAPKEGVLVACDPSPRVLLRRGLTD